MNSDRPIILLINDFEKDLSKLINESGLPAFFLEPIFYKVHNNLTSLKDNEISSTSMNYINKIKAENEKKEVDSKCRK